MRRCKREGVQWPKALKHWRYTADPLEFRAGRARWLVEESAYLGIPNPGAIHPTRNVEADQLRRQRPLPLPCEASP